MTASSLVDLSVSLAEGKVQLTSCVYNASGPRSGTSAALHKIYTSSSGAVLTKSATVDAQSGNPHPRTHHEANNLASFNSEGLPNSGIDYYIDATTIQEVTGTTSSTNDGTKKKPYIVSLSGKCLEDNITMLRRIRSSSSLSMIDAIELNLACPNVIGKPIIGYDMEQMDSILHEIDQVLLSSDGGDCPAIGVKLPPYFDFSHMMAAATILNRHHQNNKNLVAYVVCINTVGNALCIEGVVSEAPYIASNQGFAGLSGPAIKYTALANVCKFRQLLVPTIDVVGVGGIASGQDAYDMLLAGASACQIATQHWKEGPDCFDRIHTELRDIMHRKGYTSVKQVTGKLKPWSKEGAARLRQEASTPKAVPSANKSNSDTQVYKLLSMILTVVIAILLADKYVLAPGRSA
jgi:dihydroorotate dehydrogenase (fumarate)